MKPYVARSLRHPLPAELTEVEQEAADAIRASYAYGQHLAPGAPQARLVPDEIVADWAVAGAASDCREQLERLALRPGERIGLVPMGAEPKLAHVRRLVANVLGG